MSNPTAGEIIRAKESNPTGYDDILGKFRGDFAKKVEQALQFHRDNAADPAKTTYRVGIGDPVNTAPSGYSNTQIIGGTPYYFKKGGQKITMADILGPPPPLLPNDGQVPQNAGDRIDGQVSFWDVQGGGGVGPGAEVASDPSSVANAIYTHTKILTRVRVGVFTERMGTTSKKWKSKTYPATFEGHTVQAKGDTLVQFEDLYTFSTVGSKSGLTFFNDPFQSSLDWQIFYQTVINDAIRGPRTDAAGNGGGEDPEGEIIYAANLVSVFDKMNKLWQTSKEKKATVILDYCHSSCHASCHSSRSRR